MLDYMAMEHRFAKYCFDIGQNGIGFDTIKCEEYIKQIELEMAVISAELKPKIPLQKKKKPPFKSIYKKDGFLKASAQQWLDAGRPYQIVGDTMERWEEVEPVLNNPAVLRDYLLSLGWKPLDENAAWNLKQIKDQYGKYRKVKDANGQYIRTTPKLPTDDIDVEILSKQSSDFKLVADWCSRKHRYGVLKGFLENKKGDVISMGINPCGAVTHRVRHFVVANIPRPDKYLGPEMRALFVARTGRVLVGCDAKGIEAYYLAHYLNDWSFIEFLKHNDIHDYFHNILKNLSSTRSNTKSIEYAYLYGAGDAKLGSLCDLVSGDPKKLGKEVRKLLLQDIPNLDQLMERLHQWYEEFQAIPGIDGRIIKVRSKHAILNTLLQSAAGIHMKWAACICTQLLEKKFPGQCKPVIFYHDEMEFDVPANISLQVGQIMVQSIEAVSRLFKLNLLITGNFKIGNSWKEVH